MRRVIILIMISTMVLTGCSKKSDNINKEEIDNNVSILDTIVNKTDYLTVDSMIRYEDEEVILSDKKKVYVNGEELKKSSKYNKDLADDEVKVLLFRDRSLLPLRDFADALGITLGWGSSGEKQHVYMYYNDIKLKFYVNSNKCIIYVDNDDNNKEVYIETPSILYEGTLYVPIRFLTEVLGMQVDWDDNNSIIYIKKGEF